MSEEIRTGFVRQRRNLIWVSIALFFVESHQVTLGKINFLGTNLNITGAAIDPSPYLWIVFGYLLWRYSSYWHDLGDLGFSHTRLEKVSQLLMKYGMSILRSLPAQHDNLKKYVENPGTDRKLVVSNISLGQGHHAYTLYLGYRDPDGILPFESCEWKPEIRLTGMWYWVIYAHFWFYVIVRTRLFHEYVLPLLIAGVPVVIQARHWSGGA